MPAINFCLIGTPAIKFDLALFAETYEIQAGSQLLYFIGLLALDTLPFLLGLNHLVTQLTAKPKLYSNSSSRVHTIRLYQTPDSKGRKEHVRHRKTL